jgi:hypothetical protein
MLQAGETDVRGIWAGNFRSFSKLDGIIFPSCQFKVMQPSEILIGQK